MRLTKVHRAIRFMQRPWLKQYIDLLADLRKKAKTKFEQDQLKLFVNSIYGKFLENQRKRTDIQLVVQEKQMDRYRNNIFTF